MRRHLIIGGQKRPLTLRRELPGTPRRLLAFPPSTTPLPESTNNRVWCGPVYDQKQLGACTAFAWISMYFMLHVKEQMQAGKSYDDAVASATQLSFLCLYYYERATEGTPPMNDGGAQSGTGGEVLETVGCCREDLCSYDGYETKFSQEPSAEAKADMSNHKSILKYHLPDELSMKRSLADGFSFVIGISVYEEMEDQPAISTGQIPMPTPVDQPLGGHEIHVVDYDKNGWIVKQSWGANVFASGYMTLPWGYPMFDAYTIRREI